jgi:hypothetical protein
MGHDPVGIVEKLGSAVEGYEEGQRVIAGAITQVAIAQRLSVAIIRKTVPGRSMASSRSVGGDSPQGAHHSPPSSPPAPGQKRFNPTHPR